MKSPWGSITPNSTAQRWNVSCTSGSMDRVALSKTLSHALRHAPSSYGLTLDPEGWAAVRDVLIALSRKKGRWAGLTEKDLVEMNAASDKQRFEIRDGRIRALYGHSTPGPIARQPGAPPPLLYHGTSERASERILSEGLHPMRRQYVHLSADVETARQVSARRGGPVVILAVDTPAAESAGVRFYWGNGQIWLSDPIPPRFLRLIDPAAVGGIP